MKISKALLFLVLGLWCMAVFLIFDTYFSNHTYLVVYQFTAECPTAPDSDSTLTGTECGYTGSVPITARLNKDNFYTDFQKVILEDLTSKKYKVTLGSRRGIVLLNIVEIR